MLKETVNNEQMFTGTTKRCPGHGKMTNIGMECEG
jgi:hypothetical protein